MITETQTDEQRKEGWEEEFPRGLLLTTQEHKLSGSTTPMANSPYIPLGVLENRITIEQCERLRQEREKGELWNIFPKHFGEKGSYGICTLEHLDTNPSSPNYGQTMNDPEFVRSFDNLDYTDSKIIPFRRGR